MKLLQEFCSDPEGNREKILEMLGMKVKHSSTTSSEWCLIMYCAEYREILPSKSVVLMLLHDKACPDRLVPTIGKYKELIKSLLLIPDGNKSEHLAWIENKLQNAAAIFEEMKRLSDEYSQVMKQWCSSETSKSSIKIMINQLLQAEIHQVTSKSTKERHHCCKSCNSILKCHDSLSSYPTFDESTLVIDFSVR